MIIGIVAIIRSLDPSGVAAPPAPHIIGRTAQTGDLAVTVLSVDDPHAPASELDAAPAGEHLVAMDITIDNTRIDRDFTISSLGLFDLTDVAGAVQKLTISTELASIDGVIPAGGARRGWVVYRVSDTAQTPLKLRVKADPNSGGVTFSIP
jgi:hypothetical protein